MKKSKLLMGMCLAIGLSIVFISCASGPKEGATLDGTLGKPLAEIKKMWGTTQTEFENLLGRKLIGDEIGKDDYFIKGFPKAGYTTMFRIKEDKIYQIQIGVFPQKSYNTIVEQLSAICDGTQFNMNMPNYTGVWWNNNTDGIDIEIRMMANNKNIFLFIGK